MQIFALPEDDPDGPMFQALPSPPFEAFEHEPGSGVTRLKAVGGFLNFEIDHLTPNTGKVLGTYRLDIAGVPTELRFDVKWIDHEGRQRSGFRVVDIAHPAFWIEMQPYPIPETTI